MKLTFDGSVDIYCDCGTFLYSFIIRNRYLSYPFFKHSKYCTNCGKKFELTKLRKQFNKYFSSKNFDINVSEDVLSKEFYE